MMFEPKNELEKAADELLREETRKRGSGVHSRAPRPAKEILTGDFAPLTTSAASYDEYPSNAEFKVDENIRTRYIHSTLASKLTERQQQSIELVVMRGWSYHQAAAELELSPGSVHSYVDAALSKLRKHFSENEIALLLFPEGNSDD